MSTGAVSDGIGLLQAGLAQLNGTDIPALPDEQVRSEVLGLLACLNQLTGALLTRIGAFDLRDLAQVDAQRASSTPRWATTRTVHSRPPLRGLTSPRRCVTVIR